MDDISAPDRAYLDKLEEFLESDQSPPDCMLLSDLDGFLTGIAIGPELILPSEWMPVIWGGEEPDFLDSEQATEITSTIMRRYDEILQDVEQGSGISPIYWVAQGDIIIAADWAEGFLDAVNLRVDAWKPLFTHRTQCDLLMPILLLCTKENGEPYIPEGEVDDEYLQEDIPNLIPDVVNAIYWFWLEKAITPHPIRNPTKTGRNDACPCGSGKKYKRCCGVN